MLAYFKSTDENLRFDNSNAKEALTAQEGDSPYFVLCVADLADPFHAKPQISDYAYLLTRIDEKARTLTVVALPPKLQAVFPTGESCILYQCTRQGDDALLIKGVEQLTGATISHFITTNSMGIKRLAGYLGGVEMDVEQQIDDPSAGIKVIYPGQQRLDADQVLTYLRAVNVDGGFETTANDRINLTLQMLGQALDNGGLDFASFVSEASKCVDTDWSSSDLISVGDSLRPFSEVTVWKCAVPFAEVESDITGDMIDMIVGSEWKPMAEKLLAGEDPSKVDSLAGNINPEDVTVEIRNGADIPGAAGALSKALSEMGYKITGIGNTNDSTIYPETLVIYTDPSYEGAAKTVVRDIDSGRAVDGGDFYSSDANVIVIIGTDWVLAS